MPRAVTVQKSRDRLGDALAWHVYDRRLVKLRHMLRLPTGCKVRSLGAGRSEP